MSSSILISRGKQILDYEQRIAQLQASKKNSISDLNTQLRRLETDRTTLREELNAQLASYKPQKDKPQKEQSSVVSSLSSILSLKFGAASPKPVDPMSVINAKRQRIEKMDASIAQNIDLRKKEEDRQRQIQMINKEIRRIVDTISDISRTEEEKSKTEIWCLNEISRLNSEVNDAKLSIDNYRKAIPLLLQAQNSVELICKNASDQNMNDDHLQKLATDQLASNSLIADTCLAQAWNYLSIADPNHEDNSLPPLPDDIYTWAREVRPIILELLQATDPCISRKEKIIADHEAEIVIIQETMFQERKLVFFEAANGRKSNLPAYNDDSLIKRANTSLPKSSTEKFLSKSSDNLPPLPPRAQSVSLHGSRKLLDKEQNPPLVNFVKFSLPTDKNTSNAVEDKTFDQSEKSSFGVSDSLMPKWDNDLPAFGESDTHFTKSVIKEPINDVWQSDSTFEQASTNRELSPGDNKIPHDSWSKLLDDTRNDVSYEPPKEVNSAIEKEMTISEKMDEMYLENNQKHQHLTSPSSVMELDDNPWN